MIMPKIFLDHNSTTFINHEAREAMYELMSLPLNASSTHYYGQQAKNILDTARHDILNVFEINRSTNYDLIFTSSGTEANNLVLHSFLVKGNKLITSAIEHASILNSANSFNNNLVKTLEVDSNGLVNLAQLEKFLQQNDANGCTLVSISMANSETGVIQPIKEITKIVHYYGAYLHCDLVQPVSKIPISIVDLNIDFATISGHKFGGPLGAAALIYKKNYGLTPMIFGGGQEKALRSGTENIAAIKGFSVAAKKIPYMIQEFKNIQFLRNFMEDEITKFCHDVYIAAKKVSRLPNTSKISMPGVSSQAQLINFDLAGIATSIGSACSSGKVASSYVLKNMQIPNEIIDSSLRISLGYNQSTTDIKYFIEEWKKIYTQHTKKNFVTLNSNINNQNFKLAL